MTNEFVGADPLDLLRELWPERRMYGKQKKMVHSVRDAKHTYVVACNGSGKDYTAGFICLTYFLYPWVYHSLDYVAQIERFRQEAMRKAQRDIPFRRIHTSRIVTTSVAEDHLRVLWAEIGQWIESCKMPLLVKDGGNLVLNDLELRFADEMHVKKPPNYMIGMVADRPEKFSGHHSRYPLALGDEATGLPFACKERFPGWTGPGRELYFGNAETDISGFFRKEFESGPLAADPNQGVKYLRNTLKIRADDTPNVMLAKQQEARGEQPTNEVLVPGIVTWADYVHKRKTLDPVRASVMLDAEWWDGSQVKLIDAAWFKAAHEYGRLPWDGREGRRPPPTPPYYLGMDSAEGGDDSSWVLIDRYGVLEVLSIKTQDTNVIYGRTLDYLLNHKYRPLPEHVTFDRGGGGKQHVDRLDAAGYKVRGIDFGVIKNEPKRGMRMFKEKKEVIEEKGLVKNRRSEIYWDLRILLEVPIDPTSSDDPLIVETHERQGRIGVKLPVPRTPRFALPMHLVPTADGMRPMCEELVRQLACVPLRYDEQGRFDLIQKNTKKKLPTDPEDPMTFRALIGRSPDIADALALAYYGVEHKPVRMQAGVH